jgi:heme/copper-type cytochrome/quinol oxidase subunit 2
LSAFWKKLIGVTLGIAVVGVAIGLYISIWATNFPKAVAASSAPTTIAEGGTNLTLETVASAGKLAPKHPSWVSYAVRSHGSWIHSTIYRVPAYSLVHVTIYQFDSPTGLRNAFLSQVQGTVAGTMTVDGKTTNNIPAEEASHTFAIPQLGVFVPLPGVSEEAKHPCEEGPCEPSTSDHRTVTFTFRTGAPGKYHWQCFVPCGAGYYFGNGGPMQTLGYMDGLIEVV